MMMKTIKKRRPDPFSGISVLVSLAVLTVFLAAGIPAAAIGADMPASFTELVKKASPSVVNISTVREVGMKGAMPFRSPFGKEDPFHDFFEKFFGDRMPKKFKQRGLGSGFIISGDGLILTNNHVVQDTKEIEVTLSDDRTLAAEVVGRDPKTDLALIKVDPDEDLVPLPMGDSDKLQVGEWVLAIGSPFGLGNTVTAGIVSAKYRQIGQGAYDDYIQTDASINPGNSGGPLLDLSGKVVGINSAIFTRSGGNIGIGFAIPVNMAKDLLPQLKEGHVVRGWLGVMVQEVTPELREKLDLDEARGALVADVNEDGPADKAGIRRGDVIVAFDGKPVKEMKDLPYLVASTEVGKEVEVEVIRDGDEKTLEVTLGELKEEEVTTAEAEEEAPKLGLSVREITQDLTDRYNLSRSSGLVVTGVQPGSPAAEAGIRRGDILVELEGEPIEGYEEFNKRLKEFSAGDTLLFLIDRKGSTLFITLKAEE